MKVATPLPFRGTICSWVVPSMNVTVPAGVPCEPAAAVTVAVKVTRCVSVDGLAEEPTRVVVAIGLLVVTGVTLCETSPALPRNVASPLYTPWMSWLPAATHEVVNDAWPLFKATTFSVTVPSMNVTVPVGVPEDPEPPVTVAVNVTACPAFEGSSEEPTDVWVPYWTAWLTWILATNTSALPANWGWTGFLVGNPVELVRPDR